ncbi:MAG: hypothetical protein AAF570_10705 [Bacteroidota bacterium]
MRLQMIGLIGTKGFGKKYGWLLLCAVMGLASCKSLPPQTTALSKRIYVGPGPEDMVLDDSQSSPRLLISCAERRDERPDFAGIVAFGLEDGQIDTLKRVGEPGGLVFHPHGIDFAMVDGKPMLYVISHNMKINDHTIVQYEVGEKELKWVRSVRSREFTSPNAVSITKDGNFYVSNDRRNGKGWGEAFWRKKVATVVYCTAEGECNVAATKVAFGNGIVNRDGHVYQASTTGNVVYRYKVDRHRLTDREVIAKVTGPDNLRFSKNGILVACHVRGVAFLRHFNNPKNLSPTVVYEIPKGGEPRCIYSDDGSNISAGATGLIYKNKLYVNQVMENWIVVVDLDEKAKPKK